MKIFKKNHGSAFYKLILSYICFTYLSQLAIPPVSLKAIKRERLSVLIMGPAGYVMEGLMRVPFEWREFDVEDDLFMYPKKEEMDKAYKKFKKRVGDFRNEKNKNVKEEIIDCYDHPELAFPVYHIELYRLGILSNGKYGMISRMRSPSAYNVRHFRKNLKPILQKPIRGFILDMGSGKLFGEKNNMVDFLLSCFKDPAAIKRYLEPSICLIFSIPIYSGWGPQKHKKVKKERLRQSIRNCYTAYHKAKEGTKQYDILAKKKAFCDIFLKNPDMIEPNAEGEFKEGDFQLKMEKIIFFDPKNSLYYVEKGDEGILDVTPIENTVAKFEGIPPLAFEPIEETTPFPINPLWAVPAIVAAGYMTKGEKKPKRMKKQIEEEDDSERDAYRKIDKA